MMEGYEFEVVIVHLGQSLVAPYTVHVARSSLRHPEVQQGSFAIPNYKENPILIRLIHFTIKLLALS